jgi:hypothetical protein
VDVDGAISQVRQPREVQQVRDTDRKFDVMSLLVLAFALGSAVCFGFASVLPGDGGDG